MPPDHSVRGFFVASSTNPRQSGTVQDSNRAAARSAVSKATVQRRRPLPAAETGRSCWGSVLIFQSPDKGLWKNQQTQPVALLSPRFPTARNVYQERCHQTIRSVFCGDSTRTKTSKGRVSSWRWYPAFCVYTNRQYRTTERTDDQKCSVRKYFSKRLDIPGRFYIIIDVNYPW